MPDTGDKREDLKYIAHVNGRDFQTDAANAEFIIRAVNAHDDLLAALKSAYELLEHAYAYNSKIGDRLHTEHPRVWNECLAAIKKAEAGQ